MESPDTSFEIVSIYGHTQFSCTACAIEFDDPIAHRVHFKSEWHIYNTKRRVAGLQPINETLFDEKVALIRQQQEKARLELENARAKKFGTHKTAEDIESERQQGSKAKAPLAPPPCDELTCFFCNHRGETIEDNLAHMSLKHSFYIPLLDYLVDPKGLMELLCERIYADIPLERGTDSDGEDVYYQSPQHQCITCGKSFKSFAGVQGHMFDVGHTRINLEDDDLIEAMEEFYDFSDRPEFLDGIEFDDHGGLSLPSGKTITHKDFAYIYRQKLRPERKIEKRTKSAVPCLLNVGPNGGSAGTMLPAYTLKRIAKQLVKNMKYMQDREALKTGIKNNKTMRRGYRSSIVEMYSYGK